MPPSTTDRRRGIYLLPNLFTTASLFAGFYAIVSAMHDRFEPAAMAIFIAMVLDGMDGRIARLTNTQSDFGAEYDSLSDMVSFGLAPALVIYQWALIDLGRIGWVAAFMFTACVALRLARFNTQVEHADKNYFQGLASPSGAALLAGLVWIGTEYELTVDTSLSVIAMIITVLSALLMISNVRYNSFKNIDFKGRVPFVYVILIMVIFVLISLEPPSVLFALFAAYALSGPILTLFQLRKHRERRQQGEEADSAQDTTTDQDT